MKKFEEAKKVCTGCGLCASAFGQDKVEISLNSSGELIPSIKITQPHIDSFIEKYCPGVNQSFKLPTSNNIIKNATWGNYHELFIGHSTNDEIRHNGSSGGVITGLSKFLLEEGIVDFVIGTRPRKDLPLNTETILVSDPSQIITLGGSRYSPTSPLLNIIDLLKQNQGKGVFIGRPCDVSALRNYIKDHNELSSRDIIFISFFCAGTPSQKGTLKILDNFGLLETEVSEFRYRGDGWPGFAKATTKSGDTHRASYEESWKNILSPHVLWRCRLCPDGVGEAADIVCADAWHIKDDNVSFEEAEGQSYIFTRTTKGINALSSAIAKNKIKISKKPVIDELKLTQFHQWYRKSTLIYRMSATLIMRQPFPKYSLNRLLKASRKVSVLAGFRAMTGTLIRITRQKKSKSS